MLGKLDTTSKDGPWTPSTPYIKLTKTPAFHTKASGSSENSSHSHTGNFTKLLLNFPHLFLSMSPESSGNSAPISVDAAPCCPEAETPATSNEAERWPGSPRRNTASPEETKLPSATLSRGCKKHARAVSQWCGLSATLWSIRKVPATLHSQVTGHSDPYWRNSWVC